MRQIITAAALLLITFEIHAHGHGYGSQVIVRTENFGAISVSIDGSYPSSFNTQVLLPEVAPGCHTIQIYRGSMSCGGYGRPESHIVYQGHISVRSGADMLATLDCRGDLIVVPQHCAKPRHAEYEHREHGDEYRAEYQQSYRHHDDCMSPTDFDMLYATITNTTFERTRTDLLRQAARDNYFDTRQITALVSLLTFESSKLAVAKMLYDNTIDKQNYYRIANTLTFDASKIELEQYVASRS
jgi:Domain of unknown function (DUF4476)